MEDQRFRGLEIVRIVENSPAAQSGLTTGDYLLSFGDSDMTSVHDLADIVAMANPGVCFPIRYARKNHLHHTEIMVKQRPDMDSMDQKSNENAMTLPDFGLCVQELSPELQEYLNTDSLTGVIISEMTPESAFNTAGCQVGDIIIRLNNQAVYTTGELGKLLREIKSGHLKLNVEVLRDGQIMTFNIKF